MIKEIVHDPVFLGQKSVDATADDLSVAHNLVDTLTAHRDACVGMGANMIGVLKRIIVFDDNGKTAVMFNPEIIARQGAYTATEGCLSLAGERSVKRYQKIKVRYQTENMAWRLCTFEGWTAQIIQHEIDHCNGVLI